MDIFVMSGQAEHKRAGGHHGEGDQADHGHRESEHCGGTFAQSCDRFTGDADGDGEKDRGVDESDDGDRPVGARMIRVAVAHGHRDQPEDKRDGVGQGVSPAAASTPTERAAMPTATSPPIRARFRARTIPSLRFWLNRAWPGFELMRGCWV